MASDALDKVFGLIDGYSDAMIDFQTGMTAIPALGPDNDGEGESKKAEYIEKYLEDFNSLRDEIRAIKQWKEWNRTGTRRELTPLDLAQLSVVGDDYKILQNYLSPYVHVFLRNLFGEETVEDFVQVGRGNTDARVSDRGLNKMILTKPDTDADRTLGWCVADGIL